MSSLSTRGAAIASAVVIAAVISLAATVANADPRVGFSQLESAAPVTIAANTACSGQEAPAQLIQPARAEWPVIALEEGVADSSTTVLLNLDTHGNLTDAKLAKTSGNRLMDTEALRAVRTSQYAAETNRCGQIAGSYFIHVVFLHTDDSLRSFPMFGFFGGGGSSRVK